MVLSPTYTAAGMRVSTTRRDAKRIVCRVSRARPARAPVAQEQEPLVVDESVFEYPPIGVGLAAVDDAPRVAGDDARREREEELVDEAVCDHRTGQRRSALCQHDLAGERGDERFEIDERPGTGADDRRVDGRFEALVA